MFNIKRFTKPAAYLGIATVGMLTLSSCASSIDYEMKVYNENEVSAAAEISYDKSTDEQSGIDKSEAESYLESSGLPTETQEGGPTVEHFETDDSWVWRYEVDKRTIEEYNAEYDDIDIRKDGNLIRASIPYKSGETSQSGSYTVIMPGKVTRADGAEIKGNTATFPQGSESRSLYIESKAGSGVGGLVIGGVVLAALGAGGYFAYRTRTHSAQSGKQLEV